VRRALQTTQPIEREDRKATSNVGIGIDYLTYPTARYRIRKMAKKIALRGLQESVDLQLIGCITAVSIGLLAPLRTPKNPSRTTANSEKLNDLGRASLFLASAVHPHLGQP